jgi:Fe-S cluster assembly ATP-binding protein
MGPNGSGKSTLAAVLAGRDGYNVTGGEGGFTRQGPARRSTPEERAREGFFWPFNIRSRFPA